jgi:predicted phage terminase large subunit-like protein
MFSVGLGGAITGRGAHVLLIDDYIKEIKEALSQAHRDYIWNWFVTTAMTRLEPNATVIIIATRWHSDDLIGRILKNFPGQWENICLPAEAEADDLIGRAKGEVLFPERYQIGFLQSQHELLGSAFYGALYQQRPVDETTAFTNEEWLKVIEDPKVLADDWKWARIWDLAATEGGGDYTCGTLCAYSKSTNIFLIANVIRDQKTPGQVEKRVKEIAAADGEDVIVCIEQEPGSSGKSLVEHYRTTVLPDFTVESVPSTKSKLIRAQPFLAAAEAGKVFLLDENQSLYTGELTWHKIFKGEFGAFPGGQQDDQIDTAAAGYVRLSGKKVLSAVWTTHAQKSPQTTRKQNSQQLRRASFVASRSGRRSSVAWGRKAGQ